MIEFGHWSRLLPPYLIEDPELCSEFLGLEREWETENARERRYEILPGPEHLHVVHLCRVVQIRWPALTEVPS